MSNISNSLVIQGDNPYTIVAFDIEKRTYEILRTSANDDIKGIHEIPRTGNAEQIFELMINAVVKEKYKACVFDFVDMTKWSDRLNVKSSSAVVYKDKNNNWRRAWIIPSHINDSGTIASVIMCIRDITEDQEREERKNAEIKAARTDQLTGLANRSVFYEVIKYIELGLDNRPSQFGIAFVDINGLKSRNDERGHDAGDQLIINVAEIISTYFDREYLFRHGGDEFVVISFDSCEADFEEKIEKLKNAWTEETSAAVGGVWVNEPSHIEDAIIRADRRMYLDKNKFYSDSKHDRRDHDIVYKLDLGLNYVPFDGIVFGNESRYYYITNLSTSMTRWSLNTLDYFDIESEYMYHAEKAWLRLIHPNDRDNVQEDLNQIMSGERQLHDMDYRIMNKEGQYVTCTCKGQVIANPGGDGYLFIGSVENHEVTKAYDSITGLANVFGFINDTILHLKYPGENYLLAVGINDFATINSTYGYEVGNQLLRMFAEKLRTFWVGYSQAYRLDGTKFCLAIKGVTVQDIRNVFWALKKISRQGFVINGSRISFNICGGLVLVDDSTETDEQGIQASLMYVLYQSKYRKHSEFVFFNDENDINTKRNLEMLDSLRRSVYDDMKGFYLCYQPIIDAKTGTVCGAEALLRWNRAPFGEVPPGIFIPMLEGDPCFFELGNWVIKQALTDAKEFLKINQDFVINVNVSAEQIERTGFREAVGEILAETGFPAENVCFELTERVISLDLNYLREELEYFKSIGIKTALDDFGTGVCSISLLMDLPVDEIKIDRKFVKDITTDIIEQSIVESISMCTGRIGLDICVEGVETEAMKKFLGKYNVSKHQGYFYSKPVRIDNFIEYIKK